jgi:hypothetical protein
MSGGIYDIFTGEGEHYLPRTFYREKTVFQGVILELAAPTTFFANVSKFVVWPLPVLDTLGFWDVANPTFITIPEGVNVVEMSAGLTITPDGGKFECLIFGSTTPGMAQSDGVSTFSMRTDRWEGLRSSRWSWRPCSRAARRPNG